MHWQELTFFHISLLGSKALHKKKGVIFIEYKLQKPQHSEEIFLILSPRLALQNLGQNGLLHTRECTAEQSMMGLRPDQTQS